MDALLLGAVAVVVAHLIRDEDVCIGVAGVNGSRPSEGSLPLRTRVRDVSVAAWLLELRGQLHSIQDHGNAQVEIIRAWAGLRADVPDCAVELSTAPVGWRSAGDDRITSEPITSHATPLVVRFDGVITIDHDPSRFSHEDALRFAGHVDTALRSMTDDPDQPALDVPIISTAERAYLLALSSSSDPGEAASWSEAFDDRRRLTPDAVAVARRGSTTTYLALHSAAEGIAARLRSRGIGPGHVVAVSIPSSADAIAGLAGVLMAGAAYVVLSPTDPPVRTRFIQEDSGARAVLVRAADVVRLPDIRAADVLLLEKPENDGSAIDPAVPDASTGDDPAYVTYTSGTTGTPKGVVTTVSNLGHFAREAASWYGIRASDVVLNFASLTYDFSVVEIFPTLLAGATVVPHDDRFRGTGAEFWDACQEESISVLMLPTSFWAEVAVEILEGERPLPPAIRLVSIGGERAAPELVSRWLEHVPNVTLVNGYGPTETTVEATRSRLSHRRWDRDPRWRRETPIGRPIGGARVYVLDRLSRRPAPAPIGLPGEICIGGAGVTAGYVGDSQLTARRFVRDPFAVDPGARMYRTGDLGRYLPDGEIEYLGRSDRQLKIRGFRVEPGEVEAVLELDPSVRRAAVVGVVTNKTDMHLAAFVVPRQTAGADESELRAYLAERLPPHMVPSIVRSVDRLPLLPNGKVDHSALSLLVSVPPNSAATDRGLRGTEERLARIWAIVLGIDAIGPEDNFFELGGHSILAMRLASRIRRELGVTISLDTLFDNPTLGSLARAVDVAG